MTTREQLLTQTPAEMVAMDEWDRLSELGEITLRYTPRARLWHAHCAGVMVSDHSKRLYPMSASGISPEEAVHNYWNTVTQLPNGGVVVKNAWRADKSSYLWDRESNGWKVASH
jgi:hypothetical protein